MANTTQKAPPPTPDSRYDAPGGTMKPTYGAPVPSQWNTAFHAGPGTSGPTKGGSPWNMRYDWQPSKNGGTTYLGKSMPSSLNSANAKKPC